MILQVKNNELVPLTLNSGVSGIPVGTIIASMATTSNSNWLLCDGSTYDTDKYSLLYAVLGTNVLPDLRGRFLEGTPSGGTVNTNIAAGLPNITGTFTLLRSAAGSSGGGAFYSVSRAGSTAPASTSGAGDVTAKFSAAKSNSIYGNSATVQPPATTVNYFIKATTSAEEANAYEDYNLCKTWADITDDFSLTAVTNYSGGAIEKALYNAATGRIKVFTTSTSTFSASDTHSYYLDYTGSDPNISFGDYTMVNTTLGNIQGGLETSYRVESATRLYIHSFNRNTGNAWSAGRKLCSLITL